MKEDLMRMEKKLDELLEWKHHIESDDYQVAKDLKQICMDVVGNLMAFNIERSKGSDSVLAEFKNIFNKG